MIHRKGSQLLLESYFRVASKIFDKSIPMVDENWQLFIQQPLKP